MRITLALDEYQMNSVGDLSEKQREVLDLVMDRRTNKEIAKLLGISASAVEQRLQSVRRRLGATSRADLARTYGALREACQIHTGEQLQVVAKTVPVQLVSSGGALDAAGRRLSNSDRADSADGDGQRYRELEFGESIRLPSNQIVDWIDRIAGMPGRIAAVTLTATMLAHLLALLRRVV